MGGAIVLAFAVASCGGDSTAPKSGVVVTLTADSPAPDPVITDTPNGPQITCNINLTATATGKGVAAWGGATTYWYIGPDRSTAVDTSTNGSDEVVQGFLGRGGISAGETLHTTWYFYNGAPFEVSIGFGYTTDNGKTDIAWTHFRCGPDAATAVTPTVTQVSLTATTGAIKPGDTLSVSYSETSSSGVWSSIIDASGAFLSTHIIGEHLATTVNRTVQIVVPGQLNSGVPLTISVRAYDAALVGRFKSLETQLRFVDTIPPLMSAVSLPSGQYAVGDTLDFYAYAQDDNLLGWLVYQIGAPANVTDSAAALPGHAWDGITAHVPVKPSWVGQPVLSVAVHDAAGLTSGTQSSAPGAVSIYPEVDLPATAPLSLSAGAGDMVYDEKRDLMYVGLPEINSIAVFSPATMTTQAPITLPGAPAGMDLSLSGDSLLVALPSAPAIAVIDLTHPTATPGVIHLTVLDSAKSASPTVLAPSGLRVAANGKMLVFLTWQTQSGDQVAEVDLTSGAQRIRTDARQLATVYPYWTSYLGRTRDHARVFIFAPCNTLYDASTDTFASCHSTSFPDVTPSGVTVDATGSHVAHGAYVTSGDLSASVGVGSVRNRSVNVAISADGGTAYLIDGRSIRGERLSDLVQFERIPVPVSADRLFLSPDGKWMLAFQTTAPARVSRVDLP